MYKFLYLFGVKMQIKNNVMFIGLIMLILLSVTCVSATQAPDNNSTLQTDDSNLVGVISSQDMEDIEVQATEAEPENDIEEVLEADGEEVIGSQAESNGSIEIDGDSVAQSNGDVLGASDDEDVLSSNEDYFINYGYPIKYKYLKSTETLNIGPTFDSVTFKSQLGQFRYHTWFLFLMDFPDHSGQIHTISTGQPMILKGGPASKMDAIKNGGTLFSGNPEAFYNVYILGNFKGGPNGIFDAKGLSSLGKITHTQTLACFRDCDFINAINGGFILDDFDDTFMRKYNRTPVVVFENCNFRNITGGAVIANYKCNITFKNCNFEDITGEYGAVKAVEGTNIVFENCKFTNIKSKVECEVTNSAEGVLTISLKPITNYVGAVTSQGNVKFTNCEFWNGTNFVKTNDVNICQNPLINKEIKLLIKFENPKYTLDTYTPTFRTDKNGQVKYDYRHDQKLWSWSNEGYNTFICSFDGDSYTLPFSVPGEFETFGAFNYLQSLVNNASANGVINLTRDFVYSEVYDTNIVQGILINKDNLTIDGQGHTIDAKGFSRIFQFGDRVRDVTLKNMILINGNHENYGGAIEFKGSYGTIENVEFRNNHAYRGGAVDFSNYQGKIVNCTFESNRADKDAGALYFHNFGIIGEKTTLQDSVFINNTAENGGAIYSFDCRDVTLTGNKFIYNRATLGGAIYNRLSYNNVINNSYFSANEAKMGGAIYFEVNPMNILSSNFTLNVAERGGAIYLSNKDRDGNLDTKSMSISDSYFMDNKANATEIVIVKDDRDNQELQVALKGGNNYVNAVYAEDNATVDFDNVSFWGNGYWAKKTNSLKSEYAPFVKIDLYALSTKNRVFTSSEVSDVNGIATFSYGDAHTGYYPIVVLQHANDLQYTFAQKMTSISVKNATFADLQRLIDNTPEGGELILEKDYVYTEATDANIKDNGGILINKKITILGQGHIIDAKGQTRMFKVNAAHVSMSGIVFENGANILGSVAEFNKGDIKVNDCILTNNPGPVFYIGGGFGFDFNDNWFGNDWTNYNEKPSVLGDLEADRWYFLNVTVTTSSISMSLNNEYVNSKNEVITVDENHYGLPGIEFAFNTTSNIKIKENVTGNIYIVPDNQLTYVVPEKGYDYENPIGITLKYADKSFTKTVKFVAGLHLEGLPDQMVYGNVSDYSVRLVDTFGNVIYLDKMKYIIFELSNGKSMVLNPDPNGYSNLKLNTLLNVSEPGTYNYTIYIENDHVYPKINGSFTILPVKTSLNVIVENYHIGESRNVTVVLDSIYGGVTEGTLIVAINGLRVLKVDVAGERVYTVEVSNPVGHYPVIAEYIPTSHYLRSYEDEVYYLVLKYDSKIDVEAPESITYGEDFKVKLNISNKTIVTYSVLDANNVSVENGTIDNGELIVNGLDCGDYTLIIVNKENDTVYESRIVETFTVEKIIPKMEVNCAVVESHVNITVKMDSNVTGSILFGSNIVPIENGIATFIGQFEPGYHVVNVTYQTDKPDIFTSVNRTVSFYTTKSNDDALQNTSIEIIPEMANNNVFLTAKVNPSATGVVAFIIDGESVLVPIVNGEAVHFTVLEAGTHNVLVTYTGDSRFNANSTRTTINVTDKVKKNTTITQNVSIDGNNAGITVEVDEYATGEVAFTIDGNTYKVDVFFGKAVFNGYFNEGYHVIDVEYLGDDEFESNSTSVSFTIEKPALKNTTVDVTSRINEGTVELFISLDAETNGFALIDINGTEAYVKVDYGFAYYKTVLSPGNYSVNVKYIGDEKFNPAEATKSITIEQPEIKDSNITLDVYVDGNKIFVIINVPSDATGFVLLSINDTYTYYDLTGDNEFISYSAILPLGTYNVTAMYSGDDNYDFSMDNETIELSRSFNTTIDAKSDVNETTVTISVEVDSQATGFVEIAVAGKKFYVPVVDGVAKFENKYIPGQYVANVTYLGDDLFNSNTTTTTFVVIEQEESLKNTTLNVDISINGNDVAVTVKVNENATGLVAFELDGDIIYLPINNGQVTQEYVLPVGHYDMTITYIGDGEFNANQTTRSVDVVENTTKLDANLEVTSQVVEINVIITVNVNKNATGYVEIAISGNKFYAPVVDGVAVFKNQYLAGTYVANVTYLGDDKFNAANATCSFSITSQNVSLKNTTVDVNVSVNGNNVIVTVNVNETADGLVAIELNNSTVYLPVNNGKVVYESSLPIGNYNMSVIYLGDKEFNSNKTTKEFSVVENTPVDPSLLKTVIFAPQVTTTYNGNGYLTITVKDENGKLVKSRSLSITINGKTKVVKTNAYGVAKLSTNGLDPKTYTANIVFKGDGTYAKSSVAAKVVVGKAASKLTAKKKTFKKAKKIKKYKIKLKSGKKAIKNVKVTLKVKGKKFKAKTNAKGKAVFKIKKLSKKGKFKAKIKFKGNKYYKAVTKKVKIKIK